MSEVERVNVQLNPETGLGGFGFSTDFSVVPGQIYRIEKSEYDRLRKIKHNDHPVLVKV